MERVLHKSTVCMVVIQTMVNMLAVTNQEIFHLLRLHFIHHPGTVSCGCRGMCVCVSGPNEFCENIPAYIKLKPLFGECYWTDNH